MIFHWFTFIYSRDWKQWQIEQVFVYLFSTTWTRLSYCPKQLLSTTKHKQFHFFHGHILKSLNHLPLGAFLILTSFLMENHLTTKTFSFFSNLEQTQHLTKMIKPTSLQMGSSHGIFTVQTSWNLWFTSILEGFSFFGIRGTHLQ